MVYYPVLITTLNRYTHFKRCVESLSANKYADQTELIIGLDYPPNEKYVEGYNQIKAFIPSISGFRKVTVFEREENYGPKKNFLSIMEYAYNNYDAIIGTEDDNVFSPCFLDFMNQGLNHFKNDERVITVSGYTEPQYYGRVKESVMFSYDCSPWGMGMWKHKEYTYSNVFLRNILLTPRKSWTVFHKSPGLFHQLMGMVKGNYINGDGYRSVYNVVNNTLQFSPSLSFVRNMGYDNSGVTCGTVDLFDRTNQVISEEKSFNVDFERISEVSESGVRKGLLLYELPTPYGRFYVSKFILRLVLDYFSFMIKHFSSLKWK